VNAPLMPKLRYMGFGTFPARPYEEHPPVAEMSLDTITAPRDESRYNNRT